MGLRTVHDYLHIEDKTMYDLKRLCCSRPSLVLRESVQPLQYSLHLVLSQKLLYQFLCVTLS
jgi:hypothetical protein